MIGLTQIEKSCEIVRFDVDCPLVAVHRFLFFLYLVIDDAYGVEDGRFVGMKLNELLVEKECHGVVILSLVNSA